MKQDELVCWICYVAIKVRLLSAVKVALLFTWLDHHGNWFWTHNLVQSRSCSEFKISESAIFSTLCLFYTSGITAKRTQIRSLISLSEGYLSERILISKINFTLIWPKTHPTSKWLLESVQWPKNWRNLPCSVLCLAGSCGSFVKGWI